MKIRKSRLLIIFQILLLLSCQNKISQTSTDETKENDSIQNTEITVECDNGENLNTDKDENQDVDQNSEIEPELSYRSPAVVYKNDDVLYVYADMHQGLRLFGYAKPDTTSQKMILYSIFTSDVEDNPFKCPFGAYYETNGLLNGRILILSKNDTEFVKAEIHDIDIVDDTISNIVYFQKDLIYFEKNN